MVNYVILKWGSLKAYNFSDEFVENNKELVEEFANVWNSIYENHCDAWGGAKEVKKDKELRNNIIDVLEKLYNLGVMFQNGWDDEFYTNFKDIKEYLEEWR